MNSDDKSPVRERVPELLLERLARGELSPERAAEVRRRLDAEGAAGAARMSALAASDRDILEALPPPVVAAEVRRRAAEAEARAAARPRVSRRWTLVLPTLALGAAGLLLFTTRPDAPLAPGSSERIKGLEPQLAVFRKQGAKSQRLAPHSVVKPGDQLQLSYIAAGRRFGVVASVDARGTVTLHLPEAPGPAAALSRKGATVLPHAFELDDSPGSERFVFVSGDQPFDTDVVVQALRPGGPPLPAEFHQVDVTLHRPHKEAP